MSGSSVAGKVLRVEPMADAVTEEILAKVVFEELPDPLPPVGELAEITVALPSLPALPVVHSASIQRIDGSIGVWVIENGGLRFVPITLGVADLDGRIQVLQGLNPGHRVALYSQRRLDAHSRITVVDRLPGVSAMISLAGRDISHAWGKFVFTGIGLGLLIGVTLSMAGIYRGMVDDAKALLDNSGADLWVVQQDTLGPYAESSSLYDDQYRGILSMAGVARAANVTYFTMQVRLGDNDVRAMVVGIVPGVARSTRLSGRRPAYHPQPLRSRG